MVPGDSGIHSEGLISVTSVTVLENRFLFLFRYSEQPKAFEHPLHVIHAKGIRAMHTNQQLRDPLHKFIILIIILQIQSVLYV
jgi:hypothetical protein